MQVGLCAFLKLCIIILHYGNPAGARSPAPWNPPTNGVGHEAGRTETSLLATGCTGNKVRGREGDVSRYSLSIHHLPHPTNIVPSCFRGCKTCHRRGRNVSGAGSHTGAAEYPSRCVYTAASYFNQVVFTFFGKCREREFIRFRPCLSDRMLIFKRNEHLWLLDGIFLPVRLVHKPNKCLDSKEKRLFRFSQDWLHLCSRSV